MTSMLEQVKTLIESAIPMSHIIVFDSQTGFINQKHGTILSVSEKESGIPSCVFHLLNSNLRVDVHDNMERSQRCVKMNKEDTISNMMSQLTNKLDNCIEKHQKRIRKDRIYFRELLSGRVSTSNIEKVRDILLNVYVIYHKDTINNGKVDGKAMMEMCKALHEKYIGRS